MGFRFRKTIRLVSGLRLNIAKKGVSVSLGGKGLTVNLGKKGLRRTVGLPGSGMSYSNYKAYKDKFGSGSAWIWIALATIAVVFYVVTHH